MKLVNEFGQETPWCVKHYPGAGGVTEKYFRSLHDAEWYVCQFERKYPNDCVLDIFRVDVEPVMTLKEYINRKVDL